MLASDSNPTADEGSTKAAKALPATPAPGAVAVATGAPAVAGPTTGTKREPEEERAHEVTKKHKPHYSFKTPLPFNRASWEAEARAATGAPERGLLPSDWDAAPPAFEGDTLEFADELRKLWERMQKSSTHDERPTFDMVALYCPTLCAELYPLAPATHEPDLTLRLAAEKKAAETHVVTMTEILLRGIVPASHGLTKHILRATECDISAAVRSTLHEVGIFPSASTMNRLMHEVEDEAKIRFVASLQAALQQKRAFMVAVQKRPRYEPVHTGAGHDSSHEYVLRAHNLEHDALTADDWPLADHEQRSQPHDQAVTVQQSAGVPMETAAPAAQQQAAAVPTGAAAPVTAVLQAVPQPAPQQPAAAQAEATPASSVPTTSATATPPPSRGSAKPHAVCDGCDAHKPCTATQEVNHVLVTDKAHKDYTSCHLHGPLHRTLVSFVSSHTVASYIDQGYLIVVAASGEDFDIAFRITAKMTLDELAAAYPDVQDLHVLLRLRNLRVVRRHHHHHTAAIHMEL